MRIPPTIFNALGRILLFLALEVLCLVMIAKDGIIERFIINVKLESVSSFFMEKGSNAKKYFKIADLHDNISHQNVALLNENQRLKSILDKYLGDSLLSAINADYGAADSPFEYDWAQVVKNKFNSGHNYLVINRGSEDGVEQDMGLITATGVVGIIRSVGRHHAIAVSFLNPTQKISAKLGKENAYGILGWDGKSLSSATLTDIQQHIAVNPGDTVYTGGHSSIFPANIPVGVVLSSELKDGMHKSAKVRLLQDYTLLDFVYIVKNRAKMEIDSLSAISAQW